MISKLFLLSTAVSFAVAGGLSTAFLNQENSIQTSFSQSDSTKTCCQRIVVNKKPIFNNRDTSEKIKPKISNRIKPDIPEKSCVFQTVFNEENSEGFHHYKTPEKVQRSINDGLTWLVKAQQVNGGWGAGLHSKQNIIDPHAVKTDPATTSMVAMAILRSGSTLTTGQYSESLIKATKHLLENIEKLDRQALRITSLSGTQIQAKLGQNIDVVNTAQYFSNLISRTSEQHPLYNRIKNAMNRCVDIIQKNQESNGATRGAGWAGVLQSSMANAALESAKDNGAKVDMEKLEQARKYQESHVDVKSGSVDTRDGAGIVLYSVSSSARNSATKAKKVKASLLKAIDDGIIEQDEEVTPELLEKIGYNSTEATQLNTSYKIYETAKRQAQDKRVMNGFGNNGGEEFISFLQTGESLAVGQDDSWEKWYHDISGKMLAIQNRDGSWNGHHCITSPVYCTATSLMILTIQNDIDILSKINE